MVDEIRETRTYWKDYGPPVIGALIVLAILVGGWYLLRNRQQQQQLQTIQEQLTEALPSPSPSPSPSPLPSPPATDSAQPSELPATGFPQATAAGISLLFLGLGWKLRKKFI